MRFSVAVLASFVSLYLSDAAPAADTMDVDSTSKPVPSDSQDSMDFSQSQSQASSDFDLNNEGSPTEKSRWVIMLKEKVDPSLVDGVTAKISEWVTKNSGTVKSIIKEGDINAVLVSDLTNDVLKLADDPDFTEFIDKQDIFVDDFSEDEQEAQAMEL